MKECCENKFNHSGTCMTNQSIEEKWKIDFRKEFPSFLTDNHNGKIVPIYNGWWVFVQGYKRRNLPQDIEDFIENLLEQERQRMSEEIEKLKQYNSHIGIGGLHSADMQIVHNDAIDKALSIINK